MGSSVSSFSGFSIKSLEINGKKYIDNQLVSCRNVFPLDKYIEFKNSLEKILEKKESEECVSLNIFIEESKDSTDTSNKNILVEEVYKTIEGFNECSDFLKIFNLLSNLTIPTSEYKYILEISFYKQNIPFFKYEVDIDTLEKVCENLTSTYCVSVKSIPVIKDGLEIKRFNIDCENVLPHKVLKSINYSKK